MNPYGNVVNNLLRLALVVFLGLFIYLGGSFSQDIIDSSESRRVFFYISYILWISALICLFFRTPILIRPTLSLAQRLPVRTAIPGGVGSELNLR